MTLAPPLLIYPLAQWGILLSTSGDLRVAALLVAVWSVGMAALLSSKWPEAVIAAVSLAYSLACLFLLPKLACRRRVSSGLASER